MSTKGNEMAENLGLKWSGKEDSNLRPLPPEDAEPVSTRRFSVPFVAVGVLSDGVCSRLIHGQRFMLFHRPLSIGRGA